MMIRALKQGDQELLWEFLRLAAHEDSIAAVQNEPLLARYAQNWGREGDFGCVAYHGERYDGGIDIDRILQKTEISGNEFLVGVAWARVFTETDPGFGFLSTHIPEILLAVRPEWRGRGAGYELLDALSLHAALIEKCEALSLSVRNENVAALRLYRQFGFEKVKGSETINRAGGTSFTMRWNCNQLNFIANSSA